MMGGLAIVTKGMIGAGSAGGLQEIKVVNGMEVEIEMQSSIEIDVSVTEEIEVAIGVCSS